MTTVNLNELELNEFRGKQDKNQHCLATVYFELQPGDHLGRHTDSAEELNSP